MISVELKHSESERKMIAVKRLRVRDFRRLLEIESDDSLTDLDVTIQQIVEFTDLAAADVEDLDLEDLAAVKGALLDQLKKPMGG